MYNYIPLYVDLAVGGALSLCAFVVSYRKAALNIAGKPVYFAWWSLIWVFLSSLIVCLSLNFAANNYAKKQAVGFLTSNNLSSFNEIVAKPKILQAFSKVGKSSYKDMLGFYADNGVNLPLDGTDKIVQAAFLWQKHKTIFSWFIFLASLLVGIFSFILTQKHIRADFKIRIKIEKLIYYILQAAAIVAIATTCAIVLSLIFQTWHFFKIVSLRNFFMSTVWDPRFSADSAVNNVGQFGVWPLMLGTLYIAAISLIVATPIGLFAAIYMAEYARPSARSIIKLLLEILAGIPTIVYGFFALMVVGPLLRDTSAYLGGGQPFIMAQSVLTAGLVIGIMLIPFISSLADDALKAVPQSLRYGSYGLGATQAETIKYVVLPAALPGIVGALLLSASRAIGETMIVVLAAGVAPNLSLNPFTAMTTITVKIVNQLTGDTEFTSPQTLVAFALGMTLFVFTLLLNIVALYIVRKYREQYE